LRAFEQIVVKENAIDRSIDRSIQPALEKLNPESTHRAAEVRERPTNGWMDALDNHRFAAI